MWEAAQFCVLSRLRTPLGKPQDTFAAIETAVKHCAAAVQGLDTISSSSASKATGAASLQGIVLSKMSHCKTDVKEGVKSFQSHRC